MPGKVLFYCSQCSAPIKDGDIYYHLKFGDFCRKCVDEGEEIAHANKENKNCGGWLDFMNIRGVKT